MTDYDYQILEYSTSELRTEEVTICVMLPSHEHESYTPSAYVIWDWKIRIEGAPASEVDEIDDTGPLVSLAALDLYHFLHQTPPPADEVVGDRLPLYFEAATADSLPYRQNPQMTYKPTPRHKFTCQDICFNVPCWECRRQSAPYSLEVEPDTVLTQPQPRPLQLRFAHLCCLQD